MINKENEYYYRWQFNLKIVFICIYIFCQTYMLKCKYVTISHVNNLAFTQASKFSRAQKPIGLICRIFSVDSVEVCSAPYFGVDFTEYQWRRCSAWGNESMNYR